MMLPLRSAREDLSRYQLTAPKDLDSRWIIGELLVIVILNYS